MNSTRPHPALLRMAYITLAWVFLFGAMTTGAWANNHRKVLVLHSYHKGLSWTDAITQGIETKFQASGITIQIEYAFMDTKRVFNQDYLAHLVELYRVKYQNRRFDAIISSDDHAFQFLLKHRNLIFGATPIIFCGVNDFSDDMIAGKPDITGVVEGVDMPATINAALALQPHARRLVAIVDHSVSGRANKKRLEAIVHRLDRPVKVSFVEDRTMAEVKSHVTGLSPDDILLWLVFSVDRENKFYSFEESTREISNNSHAPMYAFWDFNMGHGIVGGKLTNGNLQGERAAELALRIIMGDSVLNLPVIKESPNQFIFDYRQLKRFGLDASSLPTSSKVINRPNTFYSQNRQLFWSLIVIFTCMSTIIMALLLAIAARKKTEHALVASKDRYLNVFNSASVALIEADFSTVRQKIDQWAPHRKTSFREYLDDHPEALRLLAGYIKVNDVNPAAVILFRAPDKDTLIEALLENILPDQSAVLKEILIALAENRDHLVWEDEIKNMDDVPLHVILSLNFPHDKAHIRRLVVSVFNITERKMSEQALRRSEDRFRTVFNQAASGMAIIDLDGAYLRTNNALCQMLGYSENELLKLTWKEITHQEDIAISMTLIESVTAGQAPLPIEKRYIHKTGRVVHVYFNLAAIYDKKHRPLNLIAQFQDMTQIKATQAALRVREERYRHFFEGSLSGVFLVTPDGKLLLCNDVFAKMLGFRSQSDVIGTNIINYYKDPSLRPHLISQIIENNRIEHYELDFIREDGSTVQSLINAIGHFNAQGRLIEIQGYLMDITRLKSLEVQLLHAQKMESIGTMAGGVAHDFNNLLMGIMGNTSLMLLKKYKKDPDYQRLTNIEQLVKSGSDLTRQLLGFAKGGKYEVRTTDLNELIRGSIKMFARTHKQIQVHTDLAADLKMVEADRSQIDQVLYNLYLNAWQAMEDSGRLNIQTRNRQLNQTRSTPYGLTPGNYVEVLVQDNGIGMDAKTQQRIFDPFFTTKERERGTGLGLASAYGIIQNHAGSITVKSRPKDGASFTIFLPTTSKKLVQMPTEPTSQLVGGTETILLVDDEKGVLEAVGSMLNQLGYTVLTAADGNTAVGMFSKKHQDIDIIILDMVMPGMGGKEAFENFKQIDPDVKVLLCSGFAADGQAARIIEDGCMGFIQKPFTLTQLSQKISQVFQKN